MPAANPTAAAAAGVVIRCACRASARAQVHAISAPGHRLVEPTQAHRAKRGQPAASRRTSSDHTAGRAALARRERAATAASAAWAVPSSSTRADAARESRSATLEPAYGVECRRAALTKRHTACGQAPRGARTLARAMFSRLPRSSMWLSPTLVTRPHCGRTNPHSSSS